MKLEPIAKSEAARYMGISGDLDPQIQKILDKAEETARNELIPNYVYRESALEFRTDGVYISGMSSPLTGKDIVNHLRDCTRAVLLAATLTASADKLIRQARIEGMAEALAMDCICSAAIEQVCDRAETEIFYYVNAPFRTWRFSPGYGDLPITAQSDILKFLNAHRRIGLTVTPESLLIPSKSVTAIIGISDSRLMKNPRGCSVCSIRDTCAFTGKGGCGKNNSV